MQDGQDLVELAEQSSGHLVLLLSKDSWPKRLPRERWDPMLLEMPLACVLLNDCPFPPLLRRRAFFESQLGNVERALKRWVWGRDHGAAETPLFRWSAGLEPLYARLADRAGVGEASAAVAVQFAEEAGGDFELVVWIACHERTLVECTGELGARLGLKLEGQEPENRRRIEEVLAERRCLVVMDAPSTPVRAAYAGFARTSLLLTTEPHDSSAKPHDFGYALRLVRASRLAEAYELLYTLIEEDIEVRACARELAWICDRWGRTDEARRLRRFDRPPSNQMSLFEEEAWLLPQASPGEERDQGSPADQGSAPH